MEHDRTWIEPMSAPIGSLTDARNGPLGAIGDPDLATGYASVPG